MSEMSLDEARLFRVLTSFFGVDRIVWSMSVRSVCGSSLAPALAAQPAPPEGWCDRQRCLFTVVDGDDTPKLVMEFAPDFSDCIEVAQLERQQWLPQVLGACGVRYVTISAAELDEIVDPAGGLDLVAFLKDKIEGGARGEDGE